jgi:hypothetical protein
MLRHHILVNYLHDIGLDSLETINEEQTTF